MKIKNLDKFTVLFLFSICVSFIKYFLHDYSVYLSKYVLTSYLFNYIDYGFRSRMFMGTIYKLIIYIFPQMQSELCLWIFNIVLTVCLDIYLYFTCKKVIRSIENTTTKKIVEFILTILSIYFVISVFAFENLGKLDTPIYILTLIMFNLIVDNKRLWLIPLLSIICTLIHEGFALMTFNVIFCCLLYKLYITKDKKYLNILICTCIVIVTFMTYFMFLIPKVDANTFNIYYTKLTNDHALFNFKNKLFDTVIYQRFGLEYDKSEESAFKIFVLIELPIFLISVSPCLIQLYRLCKSIILNKVSKYLTLLGVLMILPQYIRYCDFGRYFIWILLFICLFTSFVGKEDQTITANIPVKNMIICYLDEFILAPADSVYQSSISKLFVNFILICIIG